MANIKRKMKNEKAAGCMDCLEGSLNDVREYLNEIEAKYGPDAKLYHDWDYDYMTLEIRYQREETEAEALKRHTAAEKARARREAQKLKKEEQERAMLAKLLEKYGEE